MHSQGDNAGFQRKRRTRSHILEDLSENHLERKVLARGHLLLRPRRDYGIDVTMFHFSEDGSVESGEVRFQLKATDNLRLVVGEQYASVRLDPKDLRVWAYSMYPIILVIFDAVRGRAFWLDIRNYVDEHPEVLNPHRRTVSVRVPCKNKLTVRAIDHFRQLSLHVASKFAPVDGDQDGSRKPR